MKVIGQVTTLFQSKLKLVADALLSAKRRFDRDYFGYDNATFLPWWIRALFLPYLGAGMYYLIYSVVFANQPLFASGYGGGLVMLGVLLFGGLGLVGAVPALLCFRLLVWLQIPTPVTVILATYASMLVAFLFIDSWLAMVNPHGFELGIVPITLSGMLALIVIPHRQYALINQQSERAIAARQVLISSKKKFDRTFFGLLNIVRLPWWAGASLVSCLAVGLINIMLLRDLKSRLELFCFPRMLNISDHIVTEDFSMGVEVGLCGALSAALIWSLFTKHSIVTPQSKFVIGWVASMAIVPLVGILCWFGNLPLPPIWRFLLLASCGGLTTLLAMPYEQLTSQPIQPSDGSVPSVVST